MSKGTGILLLIAILAILAFAMAGCGGQNAPNKCDCYIPECGEWANANCTVCNAIETGKDVGGPIACCYNTDASVNATVYPPSTALQHPAYANGGRDTPCAGGAQ